MSYIFVGLGNPGEKYEETRHNTGRIILQWFGKLHNAEWKTDNNLQAQVAKVQVLKGGARGNSGKVSVRDIFVTLILPEIFMNNSGKSLKSLVNNQRSAEKLMVIYDDLDLPLGSAKISFNKSSGGHKGLESIIKTIKTEKFPRIRIGISPTSPSGKLRKPQGEEKVIKHILAKFKSEEVSKLKKLSKKVNQALETFISFGLEKAMTNFN